MKMSQSVNPDMLKERNNSSINLEKMKSFLGEITYGSSIKHHEMMEISNSN